MKANDHKHAKNSNLKTGWTTGACATAATKAALLGLWGGAFPPHVTITLPKGQTPRFALDHTRIGKKWAEAGITKDAGDDPDVTHGVLVIARVAPTKRGILFRAGEGVGIVTKPGLPVAVGEPAVNPGPRRMMEQVVSEVAAKFGKPGNIEITLSIPNGASIAPKTWNPRLGITGGLSILGTTGIVRPFSCAAWISSIHRGIDVACADGLSHVAGCTGSTSERWVQSVYDLPDHAMLDMGDFAGGMLKYLARHPIPRVTIGGGIGKMTKLAQGARDLHSARSQVDFIQMARWAEQPNVEQANSALHALELAGTKGRERMLACIARNAVETVRQLLDTSQTSCIDIVIVDRAGAELVRLETAGAEETLWMEGRACS